MPTLSYVDIIGTTGTLIVVSAYFGKQVPIINSDESMIPTLTPLKSTLLGFSLIHNFNLASALMETF